MDRVLEYLKWNIYTMFKLRNREVLFCDENLPQNRLLDQDQPIEQNRIEKYFYSVYSIEWGLNNRDYDFKGVWGQKPYTNDEILKFMKMEYDWCIARLEKEGLLEDYKGFKSILSSTTPQLAFTIIEWIDAFSKG